MIIPMMTLAVTTIASRAKRTPITIPATDGLPPAVSQISQEMMAIKQLHKINVKYTEQNCMGFYSSLTRG